MTLSRTELWLTMGVIVLLLLGHMSNESDKVENLERQLEVQNEIQEPPDNAVSYNFQDGSWRTTKEEYDFFTNPELGHKAEQYVTRNGTLFDEEIRILREKQSFNPNGSYIYTPGRNVPSYKKKAEKEIEAYIDEHGEEMYEELRDKYGN